VRLTESQKDFAWRNMGAGIFHSLRVRKARPRLGRLDRETIDQEVALAVCKAAAGHRPEAGTFSTHVGPLVRQGLQRALKRETVVSPPWWYTDAHYAGRGDDEMRSAKKCFEKTCEPVPSDRVADDVFEGACVREFRDRVLSALTERPRDIIRRHYFEGERLEDIAASMGISRQRVQQMHAAAIERLSLLYFD
jgi:RNA polymerase sigma factor (sigma-70 family)